MSAQFNLQDIEQILRECPVRDPRHHFGRPFVSAYQIAIRFAEEHPGHPQVKKLPVGGEGKGPEGLAKRIAIFLSKEIERCRKKRIPIGIEGGFLSHDLIGGMWFKHGSDEVHVSRKDCHSIFRLNDGT